MIVNAAALAPSGGLGRPLALEPALPLCHDPDASGHGTCTTTVCHRIVSLSTVPLVPLLCTITPFRLIYDNTPLDLLQLCLVVSCLVVSTLRSPLYINPVYT